MQQEAGGDRKSAEARSLQQNSSEAKTTKSTTAKPQSRDVAAQQSIVAGEYVENELRKAFALSERLSICMAVEAEEKAKGKERQKQGGGDQKSAKAKSIVKNSAQPKPAANPPKSCDIAAQQSGLGSHDTASKVAKVVDKGSKDLAAAIDKGAVSINAAGHRQGDGISMRQSPSVLGGVVRTSDASKN